MGGLPNSQGFQYLPMWISVTRQERGILFLVQIGMLWGKHVLLLLLRRTESGKMSVFNDVLIGVGWKWLRRFWLWSFKGRHLVWKKQRNNPVSFSSYVLSKWNPLTVSNKSSCEQEPGNKKGCEAEMKQSLGSHLSHPWVLIFYFSLLLGFVSFVGNSLFFALSLLQQWRWWLRALRSFLS